MLRPGNGRSEITTLSHCSARIEPEVKNQFVDVLILQLLQNIYHKILCIKVKVLKHKISYTMLPLLYHTGIQDRIVSVYIDRHRNLQLLCDISISDQAEFVRA